MNYKGLSAVLHFLREALGKVLASEFLLRFNTEDYQITVFADGRAIIYGTPDESTAKSLYAKYVGM